MATPHPRLYFGPGKTIEFTMTAALPLVVYSSPSANEITLSNFQGSFNNSLNTLIAIARTMDVDLSQHAKEITTCIDSALVTDKAFVRAFKSDINIEFGFNSADNDSTLTMYVVISIGVVTRQFIHSTVKASTGYLVGNRFYGNAVE